jgi:hypothetical protein
MANLASSITGNFFGQVAGSGIVVTAVQTGPNPNFAEFAADGRWGFASEISGGGYDLTSQEYRDPVTNALQTGKYTIRVTSSGNINPANSHITRPIWFDFQTSQSDFGTAKVAIDSWLWTDFHGNGQHGFGSGGYTIVANPYSFCVWCPDQAGVTAMFAAAPYIPIEDGFDSAYSMFFIGPYMTGLSWNVGCGFCIDTPLSWAQYTGISGYPRILALRSPGGTPLTTPSGAPVVTNAWAMYAQAVNQTPFVVGKLWDCCVMNDVAPMLGSVINGDHFVTLSSQAAAVPGTPADDGDGSDPRATRCSLMFRGNY